MIESGLWIILLESVLALALLVFIVWWTMPRSKKSARPQPTDAGAGDSGRDQSRRP